LFADVGRDVLVVDRVQHAGHQCRDLAHLGLAHSGSGDRRGAQA
jgi:hypothetical protein